MIHSIAHLEILSPTFALSFILERGWQAPNRFLGCSVLIIIILNNNYNHYSRAIGVLRLSYTTLLRRPSSVRALVTILIPEITIGSDTKKISGVNCKYNCEPPIANEQHNNIINQSEVTSIKRTVWVHTKVRSIGELERARNTDFMIYPSFLRPPLQSTEARKDTERDAYLILSFPKIAKSE